MRVAVKKKSILTSVVVVSLFFTLPANAQIVPEEWVSLIEDYLTQVDIDTTAETVVYIVQSLRGHGIKDNDGHEVTEIVQLGVYIFNELHLETPTGSVVGIGKKGLDNGVLVLVAMEEHEWRIEVGYGLEGDITDLEADSIAQQYLIPRFQEENYGEGLYDTVVALSAGIPDSNQTGYGIRGRYFYENTNPPASDQLPPWAIVLLVGIGGIVVLVVIVILYLIAKGKIKVERSRSRGWDRGGGGWGGGSSGGKGGSGGGGGRSGGGGAGGKW